MLAMWVKVRVKPEGRQRFLKAIEVDALGSERDEAGYMRFNVLQDEKDENIYYFYEVYKDQAALEAHRTMPRYATWRTAAATLDGPTEATRCAPVFPAAESYWRKRPNGPPRGSDARWGRPGARGEPPQPLARERHGRDRDGQRPQGIGHRVGDGGRRRQRAAFASTLDAERIKRRGRHHVVDVVGRHGVGTRERVLHQLR